MSHVVLLGFERASDEDVWTYARAKGYTIVTKDADFSDLLVLRGFPPKVIWLRLGNCTTLQLESALRRNHEAILEMADEPSFGIFFVS